LNLLVHALAQRRRLEQIGHDHVVLNASKSPQKNVGFINSEI
jgi:hypothetical protein